MINCYDRLGSRQALRFWRVQSYGIQKLGSLDAIHLASADPFRPELTGFVTYDGELAAAAVELGIPIVAPG